LGCGVYYWTVTYWWHRLDWVIMAIKTFTDATTLPASDINTYLTNSGLVYVKEQAVTAGGTSVAVTGAFNSSFDSYRIIFDSIGGTSGNSAFLTLNGSAGVTYYWSGRYWPYTGASGDAQSGGATVGGFWLGIMGAGMTGVFDIINPYVTGSTTRVQGQSAGATYGNVYQGYDTATTQSSGFTITLAAGTLTAGKITVYGYRKA